LTGARSPPLATVDWMFEPGGIFSGAAGASRSFSAGPTRRFSFASTSAGRSETSLPIKKPPRHQTSAHGLPNGHGPTRDVPVDGGDPAAVGDLHHFPKPAIRPTAMTVPLLAA
jgi:hypothetical protein